MCIVRWISAPNKAHRVLIQVIELYTVVIGTSVKQNAASRHQSLKFVYSVYGTRYVGVSRVLVVDPEKFAFLSRVHSLRTKRRTSGFGLLAARTKVGRSSERSRSRSSVSSAMNA